MGQDYFTTGATDEIRRSLGAPNGKGREPILLTEQGYLLLVKSFHDDLAWRVQRELVAGYFRDWMAAWFALISPAWTRARR